MSAADYGLSDVYTGLTDTAIDFSGSTTLQDVQLGSPLVLDPSAQVYVTQPDAAVTDLLPTVPTTTYNPTASDMAQMLAGTSDTPPNAVAASASSTTPNVAPPSAGAFNALNALSKFGSGLASLFGGQPKTISPIPNRMSLPTGTSIYSTAGYNSGPLSLTTIIIIGVLVLLLLRSD